MSTLHTWLASADKQNRWLIYSTLFLTALALRFTLYALSIPWEADWPKRMIEGDSFEYFVLGKSILERGAFSYTWPEAMPNALRLPLYPTFVALTSGGQMQNLWLTSLVQLFLDSAFAAFLYKIVLELFKSSNIALVAALLYAFNPDAVLWSSQLFAESISVWFIALAVYGLADASSAHPRPQRLILGAVAGGLAPLIKSGWQYFAIGMLFYLLFQLVYSSSWRKRWVLALMCLVFATPSAAWITRNYIQWGIPSLSVGGQLQKIWTAKLIMQWAGEQPPAYTPEMALHVGFVADHSKPGWIMDRFTGIQEWNADGLRQEISNSSGLFADALSRHAGVFITAAVSGFLDVITPQNKSVKKFLGESISTDPKWKDSSGGGSISEYGKIRDFVASRLASPLTLFWSIYAFAFMFALYGGCLFGIPVYIRKYLFSPWTIFLVTCTPLFFLNGAMSLARYRLTMFMPLVVIAAIGLLRARRYFDRRGHRAEPAVNS
jgi:hypothetical protein